MGHTLKQFDLLDNLRHVLDSKRRTRLLAQRYRASINVAGMADLSQPVRSGHDVDVSVGFYFRFSSAFASNSRMI